MTVLVIGREEELLIRVALAQARAKPMPWSIGKQIAQAAAPAIRLSDRKGPVDLARMEYAPQQIMLGTYRAALSFEEQPAGLLKHLSVSSARKGNVPGPEVMGMVCEAFEFSKLLCQVIGMPRATVVSDQVPFRVWVEEFEPGHMCINVVELQQ
jgi:hypothetical protein